MKSFHHFRVPPHLGALLHGFVPRPLHALVLALAFVSAPLLGFEIIQEDQPVETATLGAGQVDPAAGLRMVKYGKTLKITATPEPTHWFSHWIGTVARAERRSNPLTVKVEQPLSFTAVFIPKLEILRTPEDVVALLGDSLDLVVALRAPAGTAYAWYKDGQLLMRTPGPTLRLTDLSPADDGLYQLRAVGAGLEVRTREIEVVVGGYRFNPETVTPLAGNEDLVAAGDGFFVKQIDSRTLALYELSGLEARAVRTFSYSEAVEKVEIQDGLLAIMVKDPAHYFFGHVHLLRLRRGHSPEAWVDFPGLLGDAWGTFGGFFHAVEGSRVYRWHLDHPEAEPWIVFHAGAFNGRPVVAGRYLYINAGMERLDVIDLLFPDDPWPIAQLEGPVSDPYRLGDQLFLSPRPLTLAVYALNDGPLPTFQYEVEGKGTHFLLADLGKYTLGDEGGELVFMDLAQADDPVVQIVRGAFGRQRSGRFLIDNPRGAFHVNDTDLIATATLTTSVQRGEGTITVDDVRAEYPAGTPLVIEAKPGDGFFFHRWVGDVAAAEVATNPLSYRLDRDWRVSAQFLPDPSVIEHPEAQLLLAADPLLLRVEAGSATALHYQWRRNGTPIPGAESAELVLPAGGSDRSGNYDVVVTSAAGEAVSRAAEVLETSRFEANLLGTFPGTGAPIMQGRWLLARSPNANSLLLYDAQNPLAPALVDFWPHTVHRLEASPDRRLVATVGLEEILRLFTFDPVTGLTECAQIFLDSQFIDHDFQLDNNRLYLRRARDLRILDLTNPSEPTEIFRTSIDGSGSIEEMLVRDDILYAKPVGSDELHIIDLRDDERAVARMPVGNGFSNYGFLRANARWLFVPVSRSVRTETNSIISLPSIEIYDRSEPLSPVLHQTIELDQALNDMRVDGNALYLLLRDGNENLVTILRESAGDHLFTEVARLAPLGNVREHQSSDVSLQVAGRYIFLGGGIIAIHDLLDRGVLGVGIRGQGTVATTPPAPSTAPAGTPVTLEATAAGGFYFSHWAGDVPPTAPRGTGQAVRPNDVGANPLEVDLGEATALTAVFHPNPTIHQAPQDTLARAGERVELSVLARGSGGLSFQWQKDGVNLPGADGASLVFPSAETGDSGSYRVLVTADGRTVMSASAELTVLRIFNPRTSVLHPEGVQTWGFTKDMQVHRNGLFILKDDLEIYDLSSPDDPAFVSELSGATAFCFVGDHLYVSSPEAPLIVYDVTDLAAPREVSRLAIADLPPHAARRSDTLVRVGPSTLVGDGFPRDVFNSVNDGQINRYDVSDPTDPRFLDTFRGRGLGTPLELGELASTQAFSGPRELRDFGAKGIPPVVAELPSNSFSLTRYAHIPFGAGLYIIDYQPDPHRLEFQDWGAMNPPRLSRATIEAGVETFQRWGRYGFAINEDTDEYLLLWFDENGFPTVSERFPGTSPDFVTSYGRYLYGVAKVHGNAQGLAIVDLGPPPRLQVSTSGPGTVTVSPDTGGDYAPDERVELLASPGEDHVFSHWGGTVPASAREQNPLSLVMSRDHTVTAVFLAMVGVMKGPESQLAVPGDTVRLRVEQLSNAAIQWFRDGEPISGATGPELLVTVADQTATGRYHAVLKKGDAIVATEPAQLTVLDSFKATRRHDLDGLPAARAFLATQAEVRLLAEDGTYQRHDLTLPTPTRPVATHSSPNLRVYLRDIGGMTWSYGFDDGYQLLDEEDFSDIRVAAIEPPPRLLEPIWGPYAYLPMRPEMGVFDCRDPREPILVHPEEMGSIGSHRDLAAAYGHLYVVNVGLAVYSLADPEHPVEVEQENRFYNSELSQMSVGEDWMVLQSPHALHLLSLADPRAPREAASLGAHGSFSHALSGRYLFVPSHEGGITLYRIASAETVELVEEFGEGGILDPETPYSRAAIRGSTLFALTGDRELQVFHLGTHVTLNTEVIGFGGIEIGEAGPFVPGTPVNLTAVPMHPDTTPFGWWEIEGSRVRRPENPLSLTLHNDLRVRAVFHQDHDRSGLPDDWEDGLKPRLGHDFAARPDDGRVSLATEYLFGLDPLEEDAFPPHLPSWSARDGAWQVHFRFREDHLFGEPVIYAMTSLDEEGRILAEGTDYVVEEFFYHGDGTRSLTLRLLVEPPLFIQVLPRWFR